MPSGLDPETLASIVQLRVLIVFGGPLKSPETAAVNSGFEELASTM